MKQKFSATIATDAACRIMEELQPFCERIITAGSLRRRKPEVSDIEILYVPKTSLSITEDLFGQCQNLTDRAIVALEKNGVLERRRNVKGSETFGERIKLMLAVESGIPVDLFSIPDKSWFNYLVCRTGGAVSNTRVAALAKSRGYKWEPYSVGFVDRSDGRVFTMCSEEDVFKFVGLPYEEPWERP